jgi:hypothetical protein
VQSFALSDSPVRIAREWSICVRCFCKAITDQSINRKKRYFTGPA